MIKVEKAALAFGVLNLVIGSAGFFGPFVTGNTDGLINIETGLLFGFLALNWAHALLHLAFGIYGIGGRHGRDSAAGYFQAVAVVFGLLALLGLLAEAGWMRVTGPEGTPLVLSIAVGWAGHVLHLVWLAVGVWFGWLAGRETEHSDAERHRNAQLHTA